MKQNFHSFSFKIFLFILLFPAFVFTSCINEDDDDCFVGVYLTFKYTKNTDWEDKFSGQVTELILNIYNGESGEFIQDRKVSYMELVNGNTLWLPLPGGNYQITVWGGSNQIENSYELTSKAHLEDFRLDIIDENKRDLCALYYGNLTYEQTGTVMYEEIDLVKNTNNIHVIVKKPSDSPESPNMLITADNGSYNYKNEPIGTDLLSYQPRYSRLDDSWQADFTVLRLLQELDITLDIGWGESFQESYSLVNEILTQHPDIVSNDDLDREDEYTIRFEVDEGNKTLVLISVNDWNVNEVEGGI